MQLSLKPTGMLTLSNISTIESKNKLEGEIKYEGKGQGHKASIFKNVKNRIFS